MSASVSVEVSLHQHLEVSQGRREERVAFTKACVMDPVWADGNRLTPPSLPTCRSETRTVPSVETRALQRSTFTQDPPPSSPYYTTISSFKCLLTEHVCKLTFLNFGGVLATTVESLERDVKNNHLTEQCGTQEEVKAKMSSIHSHKCFTLPASLFLLAVI